MLTTTGDIAEPYQVLGVVFGCSVRAGSIVKDTIENFRNLVGGQMSRYTELLNETVADAMSRLLAQAESLGADGVVCIRISTVNIVDGGCEIIAYGTAIRLTPK